MDNIATSLISDDEREYIILQKRANAAADDGTYEWALNEIERLREALCDCHDVLHKLMAIVPGNDAAVGEMAKAMTKARAALGEGRGRNE